jgi:hypothetical protein
MSMFEVENYYINDLAGFNDSVNDSNKKSVSKLNSISQSATFRKGRLGL